MEHYFTNNQDLKSEIREIPYSFENYDFKFLSDNGIFSKNKIDYASDFLVKTFIDNHFDSVQGKTILDVGCGYGFIGIVLSRILNMKLEAIDINKRAVHLTDRNIKLNNIDGQAYDSNGYDNVKNKYDYIITNPPIRAGKDTVLKILLDSKNYLKEAGELWFVINKNQGAKSTKKILETCYNVEVKAKSKGFYCFCAKIG